MAFPSLRHAGPTGHAGNLALRAVLLATLSLGLGPATRASPPESAIFTLSVTRSPGPTVPTLLHLSTQGDLTNRYLVIEHARSAAGPFHALHVLVPTGTAPPALAVPTAYSTGFFRARSVSRAAPLDADGDGMDDVYEWQRRPALDPVNPSDARLDADGDGLDNLTEYQHGTESVGPVACGLADFPTLAALQATSPAARAPLIHLAGKVEPGDGWGGWFRWQPAVLDQADDATVVEPDPGQPGRLLRVLEPDAEVNAAWWSPDPTGKRDATEALRRALVFLQSGPSRQFRIPPGRFRVAARMTLSDPALAPLRVRGLEDFSITGPGATLVADGDGDLLLFQGCGRGRITDLAFEGSGSDRGQTPENYALVQLAGTNRDLTFQRCQFRHFMHGLSHLHGEKTSVRITVRDCVFEDGGDTRHPVLEVDGAAISGIGSHWLVENNDLLECARGIEIENTAKTNLITGVVIRGNRLLAVRNLGIMAFLGLAPAGTLQQSHHQILDNLIVGKKPRHRFPDGQPVPILGLSINGGIGWQIRGNSVVHADYAGISLYASQADVADCLVSDNRVTGTTGRGIQILARPPLRLMRVAVHHNVVSDCVDRGILLAGETVVASGNVVDQVAVAGMAVGTDSQPAGDTLLSANVISHMLDGAPAFLIRESRALISISENTIHGAAVGFRCAGTNCVLHDNLLIDVPLEQDRVP